MTPNVDDATLETMERYGGSFVVALVRLYRKADPENRTILERAFAKYFDEYAILARRHHA